MKLAVVSNWDERLGPLLEVLDLSRHFDVVVSSHSCGVTKPAREIFQHTAERLALPVAEVLHIGDSRAEDFDGARAVGMAALWLDRSGRSAGQGAVQTLAEVLGK
jgi:putative hydrolase of the HAD superfamily